MPVKHTNRKGDTYYLHQGRTKTGKARYFFSKDDKGELTEAVPKGYEIYEDPNAQVFLRKKQPKLITGQEMKEVKDGIGKNASVKQFKVEAKKNAIIVYLPDQDPQELSSLFSGFSMIGRKRAEEYAVRQIYYSPVLRFTLVDQAKRLFSADRWCWRGSVDGWLNLYWRKKLPFLVKKLCPHLGKESFFDLI